MVFDDLVLMRMPKSDNNIAWGDLYSTYAKSWFSESDPRLVTWRCTFIVSAIPGLRMIAVPATYTNMTRPITDSLLGLITGLIIARRTR